MSKMKWTVHIKDGPKRVNHAAVCINDMIYSFGGYSTTDFIDWEPIPVYLLNTNTLVWSNVDYRMNDNVPFQRYGHTTVAYGDKVFMWGGKNYAGAYDQVSCFDTTTLEWSTPDVSGTTPPARDGHSACVIANKMYIFGGFESLTGQYSQRLHCLDLETLHWIEVFAQGRPPSRRDFHTAVAVDNKMYVFGGRGDLRRQFGLPDEVYCPHLFYLDTNQMVWKVLHPAGVRPSGRRSHSAWLYEDHMYIFGGFSGDSNTHFNDLYRYSIKNNSWQAINVGGSVPCPRRRQACVLHKDVVYLFGGKRQADDDLERLVDSSDLHLLEYQPSLQTLCILVVLEHNMDISVQPNAIIDKINLYRK